MALVIFNNAWAVDHTTIREIAITETGAGVKFIRIAAGDLTYTYPVPTGKSPLQEFREAVAIGNNTWTGSVPKPVPVPLPIPPA